MPKNQTPDIPIDTYNQTSFAGGINTSVPGTEIDNDQLTDCLNLELDKGDNLVTRQGVTGAGNGALWDVALWDVDLWSPTAHAKRITSLHYFENTANGFVGILYTSGANLYSRPIAEITPTVLTGSLNLTDDRFWQWVTFNGIAIGVNKGTSGDNPVKVVGPAPGVASALLGTPPKGNYIEVWNSRVWIADAANPNTIHGSKLGDPEDWTDNADADRSVHIDIDKDDGDFITGIKAWKGRLFIFKQKKIYVLFSSADDVTAPKTDPAYFKVDEYAKNIGCIAPYTIQPVLDDILFLSAGGIMALSAAQIVGDFQSSILSRNVKEIASIHKNYFEISGVVVEDATQYLLSVPKEANPFNKDITYVLDYRYIAEGRVRWTSFDGLMVGTCFDVYKTTTKNIIIGCIDRTLDVFYIGFYTPGITDRTYNDAGYSYRKSFRSKKFQMNRADARKWFDKWIMHVKVKTASLGLTVRYYLTNVDTPSGSYDFTFSGPVPSGTLFDAGFLFDNGALFDSGSTADETEEIIVKSFLYNNNGRKSVQISLEVFNSQVDQGFGIDSFSILYAILNSNFLRTQ